MTQNKPDLEIKKLKAELANLKIRLKKIESFLSELPSLKHMTETKQDFDEKELLDKATEIVRQYSLVSASLLQRSLSIGYARAARILDQLEAKKIVENSEKVGLKRVLKK
jgi:DNA segregation ATPase FtsK/SpoIIIE-like protein